MRFVRDLFSGELVERPSEGGGRQVIFRGAEPKHYRPRRLGAPRYERICKGLSLKPEDATPERIEQENADAQKFGTGCWFDSNGECHTSTRGSQNREMRRQTIRNRERQQPGLMNLDAGFGDYAG